MAVKWFKLNIDAWIKGTRKLSLEETGAYIKIICELYENENAYPLERIEDRVTGRLTGYSYAHIAHDLGIRAQRAERIINSLILSGKLHIIAGYLTNNRVEKELQNIKEKSTKGKKMARQRWDNVVKIKPVDNFKMPSFFK